MLHSWVVLGTFELLFGDLVLFLPLILFLCGLLSVGSRNQKTATYPLKTNLGNGSQASLSVEVFVG